MNLLVLAIMFTVIVAMPRPAFAYLDANTGSLLLQLLVGGVAGIALVGKLFWHRICRFFSVSKAEHDDA